MEVKQEQVSPSKPVKPVLVEPNGAVSSNSEEAKPAQKGNYATRGIKVRYSSDGESEDFRPSEKKRKTNRGRNANQDSGRANGVYKPKKKIFRKDPNRCQVPFFFLIHPTILFYLFLMILYD